MLLLFGVSSSYAQSAYMTVTNHSSSYDVHIEFGWGALGSGVASVSTQEYVQAGQSVTVACPIGQDALVSFEFLCEPPIPFYGRTTLMDPAGIIVIPATLPIQGASTLDAFLYNSSTAVCTPIGTSVTTYGYKYHLSPSGLSYGAIEIF